MVLQNDVTFLCVSCFGFACVGPAEHRVAQATEMAMLVSSVANGLNPFGGFWAGSRIIVYHQRKRIDGTLFVFSSAVWAFLAVSALEGINVLWNTPSILGTLQENVRVSDLSLLDCIQALTIYSRTSSFIVSIHLRSATSYASSSRKLPLLRLASSRSQLSPLPL